MKKTSTLLPALMWIGTFFAIPVVADVNTDMKVSVSGVSSGAYMAVQLQEDIKDPVEPVGEILSLEQLQFVDDPDIKTVDDLHKHGIGETLYVYMPKACKTDPQKCDKLHVALHGCQQFPEWTFTGKIGTTSGGHKIQFNDLFYKGPYNGIAEANGMVVLYPQAYNIGTSQDDINPYGCWEFWPFYEKDQYTYYTQEGIEVRMIKAMVDHFTSGE